MNLKHWNGSQGQLKGCVSIVTVSLSRPLSRCHHFSYVTVSDLEQSLHYDSLNDSQLAQVLSYSSVTYS